MSCDLRNEALTKKNNQKDRKENNPDKDLVAKAAL